MAHIHKVYDTDGHFIIDANTRRMKDVSEARVNLVQYDHNSERVTFELERYVDGHDMSLCNRVEINYTNKGAAGTSEGRYIVADLQISPDDPGVVIFSWLISQNATLYEGALTFGIRFICTGDDSVLDYAWNTAVYAGLTVSKGAGNASGDDVFVFDSLQAWIDAADDRVEAAEAAQKEAEASEADAEAAQKKAEAAAERAQNSPLLLMTATATGDGIASLTDAAQGGNLMELTLYGKTTQAGTPSPDAPAALVSTEDPTLYITGLNLCDMPEKTYTAGGVTMVSAGGAISVSGTATEVVSTNNVISHAITGLPAGKYTISGTVGSAMVNCFVRNADGSRTYYHDTTFEVDGTQQNITVYVGVSAGVTVNATVYPMLVYGDTAMPWEKYTGRQTVAAAYTLHGIPVTSGGNYTDENGQQWVCDEVDLARGVYVQRIGAMDAADLPWAYSTVNSLFYTDTPLGAANALCSSYPCIGVYTDWQLPSTDQALSIYASLGGMRIRDNRFTSVSSFLQALSGVRIAYPLAAPVETALPAETVNAFLQLRTYKPIMNVYASGAGFKISYVKDFESYVDAALDKATRNTLRNPETAGTAGQVLALAADGSTSWADVSVDGGAVAAADEDDIPMIFLTGTLPTTKDDVVMGFQLISKKQNISGYCEIKCQGTSSMAYPKKNFTVKTYADAALESKLKFNFRGWGSQQKFCYKANWIDITHARNVVSARLWGDVVKSRANYDTIPEELRTAPNQGAVDGFFAKVYANGVYQGRYTINIPKDKWMANMDDELETHCILCGENYGSGCFRAAALIDGTDWSDEVHDVVPASILARWNEIISFVRTSTDADFRANIGQYFDLESLIDYNIFALVACGLDSMGKNQLYMTYDGQKWYASMYDLDSTWGLYHNGGSVVPAKYSRYQYEDYVDGRKGNLLYERLEALFSEEIKARYKELKAGALSLGNIISRFELFMGACSADLVAEDYATTTANGAFVNIPSKSLTGLQHIRNFAAARYAYCDEYFGLVGSGTVPATGVTLNVTSLRVEPGLTATLVATPTPSSATDPITWLTSDATVATVANGVVTGVTDGTCYIYAKCGDYMATCYIQVGSVVVDNFGVLAYKTETALTFDGSTLPVDTGWAPYDADGKDWTVAIKYKADLSHLTSGAQKTLVHTETVHSSGTNLTLWLFTYHNTWQTDELNYCVTSGAYEFHNSGHGLTLSNDGYHYAVIAKEGNMVYHYIDGNLIENKGFERTFPGTSSAHLYIGGIAGQAGLVGEIADVRIYDEYLSQADVTALTLAMKNGT